MVGALAWVVFGCAWGLQAETPEPAAATRQRFQTLAHQWAQSPDPSSEQTADSGAQAATAAPVGQDIENTPLGFRDTAASSGRRFGSNAGGSGNWVLNTFAALGVVIGLILLCRWAYQRLGGQMLARPARGGASSVVEILSRTGVAPRNHIVLARVGHRVLVLGDSPQGLRTLANLEDPDEIAAILQQVAAGRSGSFTQGFAQILDRFQGEETPSASSDPAESAGATRDGLSGLVARVRAIGSRGGDA